MTDVIYREAVRADLPAVIALLADDVLGKARDFTEVDEAYERAFADIDADPRNQLIVAEQDGELVGFLQITYIPGLGRHGSRAGPDRVGPGPVRPAWSGAGSGADDLGDRPGPEARLRAGAAHHGQDPRGRAPLLPQARLRGQPRGHEARALTRRHAHPAGAAGVAPTGLRSLPSSRPTMPGAAPSHPPWRQTGSALLAVGVLLVIVAFWLPAWRSVYLDRTDITPGSKVLGWALPFAVIAAVFAVLSLANTGARWVWRQASLGMLISNVLACGGLIGAYWYFEAEDPYVKHELISTGPGAGLLLTLLGCLLIPLAGSLPDGQKRPRPTQRRRARPDAIGTPSPYRHRTLWSTIRCPTTRRPTAPHRERRRARRVAGRPWSAVDQAAVAQVRTRSARSISAGSCVATRAVMPRAATTARSRSMIDRPVSESS